MCVSGDLMPSRTIFLFIFLAVYFFVLVSYFDSVMLAVFVLSEVLLDVLANVCDVLDERASENIIGRNTAVGADAFLRYLSSYPVEKYIGQWAGRLGIWWPTMVPTVQTLAVKTDLDERETLTTEWIRRWKLWGGRSPTKYTEMAYNDMSIAHFTGMSRTCKGSWTLRVSFVKKTKLQWDFFWSWGMVLRTVRKSALL